MAARRKAKESESTYVCPYCFSRFTMDKVHSACTGMFCARNYVSKHARDAECQYLSIDRQDEIDYEKTVFRGKDPRSAHATIAKHHIIRDSSMVCDMCGRATYIRLCPTCHNEIQAGAEEGGNRIFVILGPKGVGKSHYMAVLINQIRTYVASEFNAVFNPASDMTTLHYRERYKKPLYDDKVKLPPTQPYDELGDDREPLVYYLNMYGGDRRRVFTFAFIDTAGEDLATAETIGRSNLDALISGAAGIVYLVDPLQMKYVRDRIHIDNLPPVGADISETLNNICNIIRRQRPGLRPKDLIDIPLAVSITKCDVLLKSPEDDEEDKILFSPGSAVRIPRETGIYDEENFEQIDAELEEYLRRTAGEDFIQIVNGFEEHCYFAVSALGNNPTGNGLQRGIMPMRVEDPFIWLLNRKGME